MATIGGNNSVQDGLVFYYDTGNKRKSFKGEPTTNLILNPTPTSNDNYQYSSTIYECDGSDCYMRWKISTYATWGAYTFNDSLYTYVFDTASQYTASFKWKFGSEHTADGVYSFQIINGNGTESVASANLLNNSTMGKDGWYYFDYTFIPGNDGTVGDKQFRLICGNKGEGVVTHILWKELQFEKKTHSTPFVNGTRSATESLYDLTGQNTLDVTNSGFDVNGLTFNGSDDYIDLGSDVTFKVGGGWTIETVTYFDFVPGPYVGDHTSPANFLGGDGISYNSWYWSVLNNKLAIWNLNPGGWYYGDTILETGKYYHTVLTCSNDGTSYQMYLNGVAEGGTHTTYSFAPDKAGLKYRYIGKGNDNVRFLNGEQPIVKLYTKELTPQQIKQNFRAYKGRFNL